MTPDFLKTLPRLFFCVALAAVGGTLATLVHLPLGWLIGALLATAVMSLRGGVVKVVPYGRELSQGLVGLAAGQRLSPEVAERLLGLLPLMLAATFATILFACLQSRVLARLTGTDQQSAFFSSLPGGVAEMTVLADRYGGDPGLVSVGQFLRILLVTLSIPQLVNLLDNSGTVAATTMAAPGHTGPLLLLLCAAGLAFGLVFARLRVPNGWLLAGVLTGSIAGLMQISGAAVPTNLLIVAQVVIGLALGARCKPSLLKAGRLFLPLNLAGTAILIAFTFFLSWALGLVTDLGHGSLVLALAPGGIAEMSLVASSMHLDIILVVAFHLIRVLMIIALSVPLMRIFAPTTNVK